VAVWAAWPRAHWDALEVTTWLQAESLVRNADRRWEPRDSAGLERWGRAHREVFLPEPVVVPLGTVDVFDAPLVPSLLLAPVASFGRPSLGLAWQVVLVAIALSITLSALRRRLGRGASGLLGLLVVGSAAFPSLFHLWPDTLVMALVAAGLGLAWGAGRPGVSEELPDLYDGAWGENRSRFLLRWGGAGLLIGAAVASRWYLAPIALALFVPLPRDRRRSAAWLAGVALILPIVAEVGWRFAVGGSWRPGMPTWDLDLLRWAALDLVAGRHLGLLVCFAPLALLFVTPWGREGRWVAVLAGALSLAILLAWSPNDVAGGPWAQGNRLLLGVYPVFWFAIDALPGRAARLGVWALAGALVWPLWLAPRTVPGVHDTPRAPYVAPWLPVETTQRPLVENLPRVRTGGMEVLMPSGSVEPGSRVGDLVVDGGGWVEVLLRSTDRLVGLRLEADEEAGVEIELRGAELRQTVFRPDGSAGFRVAFDGAGRSHPAEPGGPDVHFRRLQFRFPKAPDRPLRVSFGGLETALVDGDGT
jgi:hypothetical protein